MATIYVIISKFCFLKLPGSAYLKKINECHAQVLEKRRNERLTNSFCKNEIIAETRACGFVISLVCCKRHGHYSGLLVPRAVPFLVTLREEGMAGPKDLEGY